MHSLLALCVLVVSAVAVPLQRTQECARHCTSKDDLMLTPGNTYTYDYETTIVTSVHGTGQDKSQLQMTAQVDIQALHKCDLSLKLRGVTLKQSDPQSPDYLNSIRGGREFSKAIEKHILRFSYQNGKIEHLCPSEDVPAWVTNIHKGVLSAFQTSAVDFDSTQTVEETDVSGKCTADYQSLGRSWQGTLTLRKHKDLSTCTERQSVETSIQGTPYMDNFHSKSRPLVTGSQECEQVISNKMLQSSTCTERHVFRPFSKGGHGVVTSVHQKLSYATVSQRAFTGNDYRPTTVQLLYSHLKQEASSSRRDAETETALKELCDAAKEDVSISVPSKFSAFVYKLKMLPLSSISSLYRKIDSICEGNNRARKFFMDAIPLVSTAESAKFIADMIKSKAVSESESNFWLTSLSFISEPTAEMIGTFTPLLDGKNDQALLGISALIHTYCKSNDCSTTSQVQAAVNRLVENLGENCYSSEERKIILTLKALSNIGQIYDKTETIMSCYKNPQLRTEVRLAAIQVYRKLSCEASRQDLLDMFSNDVEDSELRVAAYLAVIKCPTEPIMATIRTVLEVETVDHVVSFVWTHLNALMRSRHPERQDLKDILTDLRLLTKYESDIRKFSSAREATFYLESIDSGVHFDNHIVFATDSYLPRTATLNLTVDVFGHTCNLFQIDGRMEGLERVVESFFGPSGYFPQKNIAKVLREKRSISNNKIDSMDQQFDARSRFNQQPYGSLDLKVFGNSLMYKQFRENEDGTTGINIMEIITKLAEEHEQEYSRSFMFLDTTYTVPMASGLPLKIAVNGTASVNLKIGGKFNVRSFENVDILGHIQPSGAIEIASLLTVSAGNSAKSGLRVVGTMHTSTILDGEIKIKNGEVIRTQLNMPRDRIDIFNMQSKLYLVHGSEEREQSTNEKDGTHMSSCTGDSTTRVLGVKLCSELHLPAYKPNAPLHPVNGPAQFSVYILKTDPTLKSYVFDAQFISDFEKGEYIQRGSIAVNTPDSKIDRDVKMEWYVNQADKSVMFRIRTPAKKLAFNGKLTNEDILKKLDLSLTMDEKEYFSIQSELKLTSEKDAMTYTPSFKVQLPTGRLVSFSGSAYLRPGQKYSGQFQLVDLTEKPIVGRGNLEIKNGERFEGELNFNSFAIDGTIKGYTQLGTSMSSRISAEYRLMNSRMNRINIVGKMRDQSANALTKYTGSLSLQASALPGWNTDVAFETMMTTGHIENTVSISLGDGVRSRIHTVKIQKIIRYEGDLYNNKMSYMVSMSYPEKNLEYSVTINHENTEQLLKNIMKIQYGRGKEINSIVDLNGKTNPLAFTGDMKISYPGRSTGVSVEVVETSPSEYRSTMSLQWQEGKRMSAMINFKDKTRGSLSKYELNGQLMVPSKSPITFSSTLGKQHGQFICSMELNLGVDKYRVKGDYLASGEGINHRFTGQVLVNNDLYGTEGFVQVASGKLTSNAELKLPNRHRITAKIEGRMGDSFKSGLFETLWDADRDPSKRLSLSTEVRAHPEGYDGKFGLEIRHRTIKGMFMTNHQGSLYTSRTWKANNKFEIEWAPKKRISITQATNVLLDSTRQQIGGSVEVLTPYFSYENLTLTVTHLYTNQQWNSDVSTSWSNNRYVSLSSTGRYSFIRGGASVGTTGKVQTSFRGYEELSFEVNHDHNSRELTNRAQVKWSPTRMISTQLSGMLQPSEFKGTMKLRTPFTDMQDLSAEVIHSFASGSYRTSGQFQWAPRKKVIVDFDSRHLLTGRRRVCTVNMSANTPFRGFENTGAKLSFNSDEVALNTEAEVTWNRNKITTGFTGSMRNTLYNKNMESKMHFTSPFANYENIQLATSLELNENSYKVNVDAQLPTRGTASFNSQGKMMSINDIEVNAVVLGHLPNYLDSKRVAIDFVHKFQNSNLRTTVDASYGKKQVTVLLIGMTESSYRSRNVEFALTVSTPVPAFSEMKADFNHNQRGNDYVTKAQLSRNSDKVGLTHKLNIRDMLNFETTAELTSTSASIPNSKLSIVQISRADQMEHNSFVQWDKNNKINLNAQYFDKSTSKEVIVKLNTPYKGIKEFEIKSVYEYQNWQHKSSVSVVLEKRNKMTLDGSLRNYYWKNFLAQLEFTSTLRKYNYYKIGTRYDVTLPKKTMDMDFQWGTSPSQLVTAKGTFLLSERLNQLEAELKTPFDDFESLSLMAKYENVQPEKSISVVYQREGRKITLEAKAVVRSNGMHSNIEITTPYDQLRQLKTYAMFRKIEDGMTGELSTQLNRDHKYKVNGQYELTASTANAKLEVSTSNDDFESINIEASLNNGYPKKNINLEVQWNEINKVIASGTYDMSRRSGRELTGNVRTTFNKFREIDLYTTYNLRQSQLDGQVKLTLNQNKVYYSDLKLKSGGQHLGEVEVNVDTPHSPLRNMKLTGSVDNENNRKQITANVKWENKEINTLMLFNRNEDKFMEAKFELNTPFEGYRTFSIDSSVRNDRYQFINGNLNAITPFESFKNVQLNAEYKSDHTGCGIQLKVNTPSTKFDILGNVSNKRFQPFTAILEIQAPFSSFKTLTAKADINIKKSTDISASTSISTINSIHSVDASFVKDDSSFNLDINTELTTLRHRKSALKVKADYDDPKNIDAEALIEVIGKTHSLTGQYRDTGRDTQFSSSIQSPLLPGTKADLTGTLSRRRNGKVIEAKLALSLPSSSHEASAKYETSNRQIAMSGKIESGMLSFDTLEGEMKYINSNSRDLEVTTSISMGDKSYNAEVSMKNYETEKFFQVKLSCPRRNTVSITATMKHDGYQAMDGSVSIVYPGNEIRIAGNMKRDRYESMEAFITINTPFEPLRMLRLNGKFINDQYKNIDCNFKLETSNRNLPSLELTSKLSRTEGSEDLSLMLQLPHRYYRTIQLLVNAHYNSDFTISDSRITLSLPPKRYSIYGQYGITGPRISGTTEIEWDTEKWSASGRVESTTEMKSFSLNVKKPNSDVYNLGGAYFNSDNQHSVAATYTSPAGSVYDTNTTIKYYGPLNFGLDFKIYTPYRQYRNIQGNVQQQYTPNHMSTNVEYIKNGRRGFARILHRNWKNGIGGSVEFGCPYTKVNDVKVSYSHTQKHSVRECNLEVDYNRGNVLKGKLTKKGETSYDLVIDAPRLPLQITGSDMQTARGREMSLRSTYLSRVMAFRSTYKNDENQLIHDASFTWDERASKKISYDFKMSNTAAGNFRGKEVFGRMDFPLRSIILKGNFTKASRTRSGGVDFYWDASRSLEKHMSFGVEHQDLSTQRKISHKLQFLVGHPKLAREVVQTNILTYGDSMLHAKSELLYSPHREHNFLAEIVANAVNSDSRESHYRGELTMRHPVSRFDVRAVGELTDNKLETTANVRLSNMDRRQSQKVHEVKAKIFKLRQQIDLMMKSNENQMTLFGKLSGRSGEYNLSIEQKVNDQRNVISSFALSKRNSRLDIDIENSENTGFKASVAYPKESASVKISHKTRGKEVNDASVYIGLERSRILKSQANWRPTMMEDLRITFGENLRALIASTKQTYATLSSTVSEEFNYKTSVMSRSLSEQLSPFFNDVDKEMKLVADDLVGMRSTVKTMYRNNEFFMQDIVSGYEKAKELAIEACNIIELSSEVLYNMSVEYLEDLYDNIYEAYKDLVQYMRNCHMKCMLKLKRAMSSAGKAFAKGVEISLEKINVAMKSMAGKMREYVNYCIVKADGLMRAYAPCLIDGYYFTKNAADKLRGCIENLFTTTKTYISTNKYYIALTEYASSVMNTIQAFRDLEYKDTAQEFMNRVYNMRIIETVLNHPHVEYMTNAANSALRKGVEIYHTLGMDSIVSSALDTATDYVKDLALNTIQELVQELYQMKGGVKYTVDLHKGHMGLEINLPANRDSLIEVFDFKSYPEYKKVMNMKNSIAAEYYENFCIWDFYYKFMKYLTPSYWLPDFKAHAMIAGNQHYITFDKLPLEFAGQCSYLLARDFVDGNFSVVVNYARDGKNVVRKSLTILSEGRKIEVGQNFKVTLDDVKTELPIQIAQTVAIREGSNIRVENERKGFSIDCNFVHNYCTMSISGFYFGKTAGLFGTYNYHPRLDMMTPGRYFANNVEEFANSWEVGQGACETTQNMATVPANDYRVQQRCGALFEKSSSELRACFKQVDPEPYKRMCINDLSAIHEHKFDEAICVSAAAYFAECKMTGVPLKMPKQCVRCEKQDGTKMTEGEAITFTRNDPIQAADVVFLVEEKACNQDKARMLSKLAQNIEENYRQKGFRDVRYSVVAFGGDEVHARPHVHTMDGQMSGPLRHLESALQSLVYGDGPVNILEAMRFAAALDYRPGTARSFVLVKCSTCKAEELKAEYSEMLRTLLDGDITLHLLMEQRYEMKVNKIKTRKVIGVDRKFAYTLKDVKDSKLSGDGDLLAQVKIPKDVCVPLALEVNGSSFDSQFLTDTKKNTNKKFMDVLARLVVKSSEKRSEHGMCCECIAIGEGVGKSTCQRCVSAEMANMISGATSGFHSYSENVDSSSDKPRSQRRRAL